MGISMDAVISRSVSIPRKCKGERTMAQRLIHYLFGDIFSKQMPALDRNRFLLGSVLPDAYANAADRDRTHFIKKNDTQVYFDFEKFREQFLPWILKDDLYLGYYMHLVEDAFYRQFIYSGRFTMPRNMEEVRILHIDYHIINSHIVAKHQLQDNILKHVELGQGPIGDIAEFRANEFLEEMSCDFIERIEGETRFFTECMADEFIDKYAALGFDELQSIRNGKSILSATGYTWKRNKS